jgi:hypothetical protein
MRRFGERLKLRTDLRFSVFYLIDDKSQRPPVGWPLALFQTDGRRVPPNINL